MVQTISVDGKEPVSNHGSGSAAAAEDVGGLAFLVDQGGGGAAVALANRPGGVGGGVPGGDFGVGAVGAGDCVDAAIGTVAERGGAGVVSDGAVTAEAVVAVGALGDDGGALGADLFDVLQEAVGLVVYST